MKHLSKGIIALAATMALASPALAQSAGEESTSTFYVGHYAADNGYEDRTVYGNFTNYYLGDTGLHLDAVYADREENAGFLAIGASQRLSEGLRAKLMLGTSTKNFSILPKHYISGELEIKPAAGLIVRPSVTYRKYRTGGWDVSNTLGVAKYMDTDPNGYLVAQADGTLSLNADDHGYRLGGGLTAVRKSGLRFGASGAFGKGAYETALGLPVRDKFWSAGANVGYRFQSKHEVFVRADYTDTRFYDVKGVMAGIKFPI